MKTLLFALLLAVAVPSCSDIIDVDVDECSTTPDRCQT